MSSQTPSGGGVLQGRRVLLGVSGSIAAYKAAILARDLISRGAEVRVVMTHSATRFVGPATFAALTGQPVCLDVFDEPERVVHVELGRWAEVMVCSGTTASTLARLAGGSGADILSATYLMCSCPVVIAPAMHTEMWEHPAVQRNVEWLRSDGVTFIGPEEGDLASGDYGIGRLSDPEVITEATIAALSPKDLEGLSVLLTAGPTWEPLDPVRYISNRSTGRMAFALATEAARRGAKVKVVSGPTSVPPPRAEGIQVVPVETAQEMFEECVSGFGQCDVAVLNAAVADWRPAHVGDQKIKKSEGGVTAIEVEQTPDIAAELGQRKDHQSLVLFAAETEQVTTYAAEKLQRKNADLVVGNLVGRPGTGFSSDTNQAWLVSAQGVEGLERMTKDDLAGVVWDRICKLRAE